MVSSVQRFAKQENEPTPVDPQAGPAASKEDIEKTK